MIGIVIGTIEIVEIEATEAIEETENGKEKEIEVTEMIEIETTTAEIRKGHLAIETTAKEMSVEVSRRTHTSSKDERSRK